VSFTCQSGEGSYEFDLGPTGYHALTDWITTVTRQAVRLYRSRTRKDHLVLNGDTICNYNVRAGGQSTPFGIISPLTTGGSPHTWYVPVEHSGGVNYRENLCSDCSSAIRRFGLDSGYKRSEPPDCPRCGDAVSALHLPQHGQPYITHSLRADREDNCERLSDDELIEYHVSVLNVDRSALPLVSDDPSDYIQDWPTIVTELTDGLQGYFYQINRHHETNRPVGFAFTHPKFESVLAVEMYSITYTSF
jgi:hypothetical protein